MSNKFEEALQTCLDLILGGNETIETAVARFPEWSEDLKPQLETALWLTTYRDVLEPRPGFVSASRRRVVERIKEERQQAPLTWRERMQQLMPVQRVAPVAFVFIVLLILFVGGSFVSEAEKAMPGDRLYSMKLTLEGLALAISPSQAGDAQIQVRNVQKRLAEIRALIEEGSVGSLQEAAQRAADLNEQVEQTTDLLEDVAVQDPETAIDLYRQLASILEIQRSLLFNFTWRATPDYSALYYSLSKIMAQAEEIDKTADNLRVTTTGATPTSAPTPFPTSTPVRTIIKATPTPAPTREPDEPTKTPKPTQPPPTKTPVPTQKPTATPVPTNTPTQVPTNTPTEIPSPTSTPVTPTDTPVTPTDTPVTPTDTPVPPTDTPIPPTDIAPMVTTPPPSPL